MKNRNFPYLNLKLGGEIITGLTLIGESTFFDMATTGWIEGDQWQPQNKTTMEIVHDVSKTPQPICISGTGKLQCTHMDIM
jgi:hypothetical protein